jgi:hypothetical protein
LLGRELALLDDVTRVKRPSRLPVALTVDDAGRLLGELSGEKWLMVGLLFGADLRMLE